MQINFWVPNTEQFRCKDMPQIDNNHVDSFWKGSGPILELAVQESSGIEEPGHTDEKWTTGTRDLDGQELKNRIDGVLQLIYGESLYAAFFIFHSFH